MINIYIYIYNALLFFFCYGTKNNTLHLFFLVSSVMSMFLMLALRDPSLGTDYLGYISLYDHISGLGWGQLIELRYEPVFKYSVKAISNLLGAEDGIFVLCSFLNIILIFALYTIDKKLSFITCCQFSLISFFLYYDIQYNILRQGLSFSMFALGWGLLYQRRLIVSLLVFAISIGFHTSAIIYIFISLTLYLGGGRLVNGKSIRLLLVLTVLNLISSYFSLFEIVARDLLAILNISSYYQSYLTDGIYGYNNGFRADFVLLTLVPIFISHYYMGTVDNKFSGLLAFNYICSNVYLLFSWIAYSDRLLVFPWMMNVILIGKVISSDSNDKFVRYIILFFLLFSGLYSNSMNPNLILNLNLF
ncbi:EpsG family protein [Escherichia coli]|uniref:EpsG family protein n=1 Tax=Escherichia coli TaxID=562 RepID=UPI003336D8D0